MRALRDDRNGPGVQAAPPPSGVDKGSEGNAMKRPGAVLLAASVVSLLSARPRAARAEEAPLPWTVRVEVAYSVEHNREAYREELQARVVQDLVSADCFQSVV